MNDHHFAPTVPSSLEPLHERRDRAVNRRSGVDRRKADAKPPGLHDRRTTLESRKPEVAEIAMSDSEWAALSGEPSPQQP
ncbi:MAG: hypothetical protein ABI702_15010 [Burkholderiales bacterium]